MSSSTRDAPIGEGWMTAPQAARYLGISPSTLRWQIANGRIKATRVGNGRGYWMLHRDDLDAYAKSRTARSDAREFFPSGVPDQRPPDVTDRQWETLIAHVNDGKSYYELSEEYGISVEAVRQRIEGALIHFGWQKERKESEE